MDYMVTVQFRNLNNIVLNMLMTKVVHSRFCKFQMNKAEENGWSTLFKSIIGIIIPFFSLDSDGQ